MAQEYSDDKLAVLQKILNTIDIAIWSYDMASLKYTHMTDAITQITGLPAGELMESSFWTGIIHRDDLPLFEQMYATAEQGNPVQREFSIYHADRERKWIQIRIIPTLDENSRVTRLDGAVIDITSSKEMEEALHRSEQRYKSLFEYNSDVLCELDLEGNVLAINPAAERITGEQLYGVVRDPSAILDIFGADSVRRMTDYFEKAKQGISKSYEVTSFHQNGKVFYWEMKNVPIYVNDQIVGAYVIAKDITARKLVEQELRDSEKALLEKEERYRRLVELSPVAIAVYKEGAITYINPAGVRMLSEEFNREPFNIDIMDWIHPDYHDYARERMNNTLLNGYSSPGEYQIICSDGRTIEVSMISIYDAHSSSIQIMFEDITDRKQAQRALIESEELNRRLIELSPEAIVLHSDFHFIYVNPAGLALFNLSDINEVIGKSIYDFIHPDYREMVNQSLSDIYKHQSVSQLVELQIMSSDGTFVDVEVIASTIPYKGANAGISLFRDITERKKAEVDRKLSELIIRESEERYSRLQMSLDRFSHDLFGVMKVDEMQRRLVMEVRNVMKATQVSLIEVNQDKEWTIKYGEKQLSAVLEERVLNHKQLPVCKIIESENSCLIKISEIRGISYLLGLDEKLPALELTPKRVWLETIVRYVSVLFDNFLFIEDLTKEIEQLASKQVAPSWLLRLLFSLSENERKRLSQDLHDSALQEQIIWYRKLDLLLAEGSISGEPREQLEQLSQGLLDVMYQIRNTCNELRPPMLKEEGLISSLEDLFQFTQLRSNYSIHFDAADFKIEISDGLLLGLYRIVQELLANATKHSRATEVWISLSNQPERIHLEYKDNGVGMDLTEMEDSFGSMGIYGMKERVRSMDGTIEFHSSLNKGLVIILSVPSTV